MKLFKKESLGYKIIIAAVIVLLFNFMAPTISSADFGGILFTPIKDLLLVLADGIISISQSFLFDLDESFITIHYEHDWVASAWGVAAGLLGGTVMVLVGLAGAPFSGGLSLAAVAAGIKIAVGTIVVSVGAGLVASYIASNALPPDLKLPTFVLSPEEIFKGEVALLDVNFFESTNDKGAKPMKLDDEGNLVVCSDNDPGKQGYYIETTTSTGSTVYQKSSAVVLGPTISKWYYALRNLAIVVLLLVLVYTAIRIIISSAAEDRAKYKQRLMDWLIAMCILFFMHYIMAFAVTLTEQITAALVKMNDEYSIVIGSSAGDGADGGRNLNDYVYEDGEKIFEKNQNANDLRKAGIIVPELDENGNENGNELLIWPTNMMGKARIELQLEPKNISEDNVAMRQFGYTVIYLAFVIYTILFLFRYLKRLMMLAFLTIVAPLMAMTYPLDKMRDGSAQGFNMWFKEYIYNLLIQPVHLILFTVLIGSAMDLVVDNLIYGLVALGFILQAEKLLRKFFGFDKASTVDGGSAFGGAMAMHALSSATKFLGRGGKGKNNKNGGKDGNDKNNNRSLNRGRDSGHGTEDLMDDVAGGTPLEAGNSNNTNPGGLNRMGANDGNLVPGTPNSALDKKGILGYGASKLGQIKPVKTLSKQASKAKDSISGLLDKNYNWRQGIYRAHPVVNALKNSAKTTGRGIKYVAPKAARFAARTALKTTMAGAGATIGLAAGLVSDDFSNVAKFGAAGLGGGWAAGSGLSKIPETLNGTGDRFVEGAEGLYEATHTQDEIEARQNAILDKQWLKDSSVIDKYQEKLGVSRKEAKEIMENNAQRYREYGITDDDMIIKGMKAEGFGDDKSSKERILLTQMATRAQNTKDLEQVEKRLKKGGLSDEMVKKYATQIRKMRNL